MVLLSLNVMAKEPLRILTWEGYIQPKDVKKVDQLLAEQGYPFYIELIKPYADGAEQMFDQIRSQNCDVSFLTLFFIKIEREQTAKLLQPINTSSPRLFNYSKLLPSLTQIDMGLNSKNQPLYIPWGGGAYGFYADHNQLSPEQIPQTVSDLWLDKWRGKFSLNKSQVGYNFGLALMSMGKSPFYLYQLTQQEKHSEIRKLIREEGVLQTCLNTLYQNAGHLWTSVSEFKPGLSIISSWGPEVKSENQAEDDSL